MTPNYKAVIERMKTGNASPDDYSSVLQQRLPFDEIMRNSLQDQQNPRTKHWIYIAAAVFQAEATQSNFNETRQLLRQAEHSYSDSILREILGDLDKVLLSHEHHEKAPSETSAESPIGSHAPGATEVEGERGAT